MTISAVVMAHPRRRIRAEEIASELGCPIVWDRGQGVWDTGRRAMQAHDPNASHHLVVQDDVTLAPDLLDGLDRCVAHLGEACLSAYTGTVRPRVSTVTRAVRLAETMGSPWVEMDGPIWGQAILHPVAVLDDLIGWCDATQRLDSYDGRVTRWWRRRGPVRPRWCHPSLVEHDDPPSLLPGRPPPGQRRAHRFLSGSVLDVDWSIPPAVLDWALPEAAV